MSKAHIIARNGHQQRYTVEAFVRSYAEDVQPLYVHLRVRGFSMFDSFVATFVTDFVGRQTEIEAACAALEQSPEWTAHFDRLYGNAATEDLLAVWDRFTALSKAKTSMAVAELTQRLDKRATLEAAQSRDDFCRKRIGQWREKREEKKALQQRAASVNDYHNIAYTPGKNIVNSVEIGVPIPEDDPRASEENRQAWRELNGVSEIKEDEWINSKFANEATEQAAAE